MSIERLTPVPGALPVAQIGNYDVIQKLATGGMGEVFLARQRGPTLTFSRYVVLKRLHPHFLSDPHFVDMFLNEAQIAANLSHPNIAHIYELFEDGANGYVIAMEYVRGGTVLALLRERVKKYGGGLPFGAVTRITSAVCEALHYAYFESGPEGGSPRNVIHRDVSPSNVMVSYDGQVKLVDFGIAKALQAEATHATALKGKYAYMSPEQIRSLPLDHRTDIFSLGTMMWEMFVGKRLFKRDSDMQMLYAILEEPIPKPSEKQPQLPPSVDHIVMRALARTRDDRYEDAMEIAQDLKAIANNNDWDVEGSTLGRIARELLPEELGGVPSGSMRAERGSDSGKSPSANPRAGTALTMETRTTTIEDDDVEIEMTSQRASSEEPAQSGNNSLIIIVLLLVIASSAFFWLGVVPNL